MAAILLRRSSIRPENSLAYREALSAYNAAKSRFNEVSGVCGSVVDEYIFEAALAELNAAESRLQATILDCRNGG